MEITVAGRKIEIKETNGLNRDKISRIVKRTNQQYESHKNSMNEAGDDYLLICTLINLLYQMPDESFITEKINNIIDYIDENLES